MALLTTKWAFGKRRLLAVGFQYTVYVIGCSYFIVLTQCLDLLGVDDDTPEPEMGDEPSAPPQTSRRR